MAHKLELQHQLQAASLYGHVHTSISPEIFS